MKCAHQAGRHQQNLRSINKIFAVHASSTSWAFGNVVGDVVSDFELQLANHVLVVSVLVGLGCSDVATASATVASSRSSKWPPQPFFSARSAAMAWANSSLSVGRYTASDCPDGHSNRARWCRSRTLSELSTAGVRLEAAEGGAPVPVPHGVPPTGPRPPLVARSLSAACGLVGLLPRVLRGVIYE